MFSQFKPRGMDWSNPRHLAGLADSMHEFLAPCMRFAPLTRAAPFDPEAPAPLFVSHAAGSILVDLSGDRISKAHGLGVVGLLFGRLFAVPDDACLDAAHRAVERRNRIVALIGELDEDEFMTLPGIPVIVAAEGMAGEFISIYNRNPKGPFVPERGVLAGVARAFEMNAAALGARLEKSDAPS